MLNEKCWFCKQVYWRCMSVLIWTVWRHYYTKRLIWKCFLYYFTNTRRWRETIKINWMRIYSRRIDNFNISIWSTREKSWKLRIYWWGKYVNWRANAKVIENTMKIRFIQYPLRSCCGTSLLNICLNFHDTWNVWAGIMKLFVIKAQPPIFLTSDMVIIYNHPLLTEYTAAVHLFYKQSDYNISRLKFLKKLSI